MIVSELCDAYLAWARQRYQKHDRPTRTAANIADAQRQLRTMFGSLPAADFRGKHLLLVQEALDLTGDLSVRTVNDRVNRIRSMFAWAAKRELVDELLPHRLDLVQSLRPGCCKSRPARGPKPVAWDLVASTIAAAPLQLATMLEVHWHTGMRSGELCQMHLAAIDRSTDPWVYRPGQHKTEHHGCRREICLGPVVQSLITTWERRVKHGWLWPSARRYRQPLTAGGYYQAIRRVTRAAKLPGWHPHQIRHAAATSVAAAAGDDAAKIVLGHRSVKTTQLYIQPSSGQAASLAQQFG